jgi:nucleoside-diphosphate-sugar epimerase
MRVFVAGATGVVGRGLVARLVERGDEVTGSTRSADRAERLRELGVTPVVLDALDAGAVTAAVVAARPEVVIHQLTALAADADLRHFDRWFATTNRLRTEGTDVLLAAAQRAGARRFVAQSYTGWNNARTGGPVKTEADALDPDPLPQQRQTMAAIHHLERAVARAPLEGVVLRYGNLYGPGASDSVVDMVRRRRFPLIGDGSGVWSWTHIDDAALAAVAAAGHARPGTYQVVDDEPAAVRDWLPYLATVVGARPPVRVPASVARLFAGPVVVRWATQGRGASNAAARRELGWEPTYRSWRDGFRGGLTAEPRPGGQRQR